ncbi:MAG: histidine phosphatase family protein [Bacillota bacterium]
MRLYVIRHADPDYENDTITPDGHLEAQALAERLASVGLNRIYCSPLGRALDTMKYTAGLLKLQPVIEEWTREMWPELKLAETPWGAIAAWDVPGETWRSGKTMPSHRTWHSAPILSRSIRKAVESLQKNSDEFLKNLGYERRGGRYRRLSPHKEKIALFCHGGFALTWLAHLLEIPVTLMWSGFWLPPTSVTTVLFDERSQEWAVPRCIGLGDVSHLYEAGLPVKPRGIVANLSEQFAL